MGKVGPIRGSFRDSAKISPCLRRIVVGLGLGSGVIVRARVHVKFRVQR